MPNPPGAMRQRRTKRPMTTERLTLQAAVDAYRINPDLPALVSRCYACGEDVVLGYAADSGNRRLMHAVTAEPCAAFDTLSKADPVEFIRRVKRAGHRWESLLPGAATE